jgi:hypothetical protein
VQLLEATHERGTQPHPRRRVLDAEALGVHEPVGALADLGARPTRPRARAPRAQWRIATRVRSPADDGGGGVLERVRWTCVS